MNCKNCKNCKHRTSVPGGSNGFEYPIPVCDKNCSEFDVNSEEPGTCKTWEAPGIPFYLQNKD